MIIEHINISAPSHLLEQEKDFFCYLFNLSIGFRPQVSRSGYWLYSGKQALVHLTESDLHQPNQTQGCLDHIAFQLTGLESFISKLIEMKVSYQTDSLIEIGMTQLFFTSPSGVGLEANFLNEKLIPDSIN